MVVSLPGAVSATLFSNSICYGNDGSSQGSIGCTYADALGDYDAHGSAGYGVLKAYAREVSRSATDVSTGSASTFRDYLTIDSPGLTGTVGTALGSFVFPYPVFDVSANEVGTVAMSHVTASFSVWTSAGLVHQQTRDILVDQRSYLPGIIETHITDNSLDGTQKVDFRSPMKSRWRFTFGQPFLIHGSLAAGARGSGGNQFAIADAAHSLYWDGIDVSVNDQSVNYSVLSQSGTDWSISMAPIPEPSTLSLVLFGSITVFCIIHGGRPHWSFRRTRPSRR